MKYSDHFAPIFREHGPPNINTTQFLRLINIIAIENRIYRGRLIKELFKGTELYHKCDLLIFSDQKKLTSLTGNRDPEKILSEMYRFTNGR